VTRDNRRHRWAATALLAALLGALPGAAASAEPSAEALSAAFRKALKLPTSHGGVGADSTDLIGYNSFGHEVAVGAAHSCAPGTGEDVWCWGDNSAGQLGDGSTTDSLDPVHVDGLGYQEGLYVVQLSAGRAHTCVTASGSQSTDLYCWGANNEGQLGDGSTTDRSAPVKVAEDVQLVAAGQEHTCVVYDDGTVGCWGRNEAGQLGTGGAGASVPTATDVAGLNDIVDIAANDTTTCVVDEDGDAWCWGSDSDGQLGDDAVLASRSSPVAVDMSGLADGGFFDITLGLRHACGATTEGLLCWGSDAAGQLGNGGSATDEPTPAAVTMDGQKFTSVSAGADSTCASDASQVWCWGDNSAGQLGTGDQDDSDDPVAVDQSLVRPSPLGIESSALLLGVAVAATHACAVDLQPVVYCWGDNAAGQLGSGTTQSATKPQVTRLTPDPATDVAADPGDASLVVSWQPPADTGVAPIFSSAALVYDATSEEPLEGEAYCSTDDVPSSAEQSCTVDGLSNDTEYVIFIGVATEAGLSYTAGLRATPVAGSAGAGGSLPITGANVGLHLVAGATLVAAGLVLTVRRRPRGGPGATGRSAARTPPR
jgi:alpha-tubulin suppressor-like RCC1 family protein